MGLLFDGSPTAVHFQQQTRKLKMHINSTPSIAKSEPFTTGNPELDGLMATWHRQALALADAEQAGLPEPEINSPALPDYINWKH